MSDNLTSATCIRAQFDLDPVYAAMTAVAAGVIDTYRSVESTSMIDETKRLIEAPWNRKTKDGLGKRPDNLQAAFDMQPQTPVLNGFQGATVLNRSGMSRSVVPGESGGCFTRLCCGRGSSRRPGYPTVGAAGQIRESRGERPWSLGRAFRSKSGGHRRLPVGGVRDPGRRGWPARRGVWALRFGARAGGGGRQQRGALEPRWRHRPVGAAGVSAGRQRRVSGLPLSRRSAGNPCRRRCW